MTTLKHNFPILILTTTILVAIKATIRVEEGELSLLRTVKDIEAIVNSDNLTLQWPRPAGTVDFYNVTWYQVGNQDDISTMVIRDNVEAEGTNGLVKVLIENLRPGVSYHFEVSSRSDNIRSQSIEKLIRTSPLCTSEMFIINNQEVTDSLIIRYTPTPQSMSTFDKYRIMISRTGIPSIEKPGIPGLSGMEKPGISAKEKSATDPNRKVIFHQLTPGRIYNINLSTISGGVSSLPVERQDRLYPDPVTNINATSITEDHITLVWDTPEGDFDSFEVTYLDVKRDLIEVSTFTNSITIESLSPNRNYTFVIKTKSGSDQNLPRRSLSRAATFATK